MQLSDVERNVIIDLGNGRVGYAGNKTNYKPEDARVVYFRVGQKLVSEALPNGTEVTIVAVPETLIWHYLDKLEASRASLKLKEDLERIVPKFGGLDKLK